MTRLSLATLDALAADIAVPAYDPASLTVGVVHFGPGAFHRAHQAACFDALARTDPRWGICGVSLHSAGVREALTPQDGLYTLAILDEEVRYSVIGSLREVLVAGEDPEAVFERLTRPAVGLVTATVTEKGYCLGADGTLDMSHPDIVHDLANPRSPRSFIGYVAEGLRRRRAAGMTPFVLIPCDNLPDNGARLKAAVVAFAAILDAEVAQWIKANLHCPGTMVDSITPATDDALRARVTAAIGLDDAWPIQREAFSQWVIEDHVHEGGPDWQSAGVTLTTNVAAYERAKLRLLNGSHSSLAYLGLLRGYETVSQAIHDPQLEQFVRRLMNEDIIPLLDAPEGLDLNAYCEDILKRFRNPAIRHLLAQIAWDGSQKLPIRIVTTMAEALARGRAISRLCVPLAAWLRFIRCKAVAGAPLTDPLADELLALGATLADTVSDITAFLAVRAVFPQDLAQHPSVIAGMEAAYGELLMRETSRG